MIKKTLIVIAILALGAAVALFFAGRRPHRPLSMEERATLIMDKISGELNLTPEQKQAGEKINAEIVEKMKASDKLLDASITDAFAEQIKSDKFDQAKLNKLFDSKRKQMDEMTQFMISKLSQFHAILSKEQREKLARLVKEGKFRRELHVPGHSNPGPEKPVTSEKGSTK